MNVKWRQKIISICISSILICEGVGVTVLLVLITNGPGFAENEVNKYMIVVLSSVSYILPGIFGFISALRGSRSSMYGFHIGMETLFLFLAATSFFSFLSSMAYNTECREDNVDGSCTCGESKLVYECKSIEEQKYLASVVNVMFIVAWATTLLDLVRSMCLSCCIQEDELPGVVINGKKMEHFSTMRTF